MTKKCAYPECHKCAQGATLFCKRHGGGNRCKYRECSKSALGKTSLCARHGGGNRCERLDCKRIAIGKTHYCKAHGGGKRCKHVGCKHSTQGTDLCDTHGGGIGCSYPECNKQARMKGLCVLHIGNNRCKYNGCNKWSQGNTAFCILHGGGRRCDMLHCTKGATGSTPFCVSHGGGSRCPHCITWPDSRSGCKKYDGYCATCFKHVFPTDPRSTNLRVRSHETAVRNFLNEHMHGFIHDLPLHTTHCECVHRRRIDHRMLIGNTLLAVETDERQHRGYNPKDEEDRYEDLYMVHSGKWIFIRFNPDSYLQRGIRKNPDIKKRLPILLEEIQQQIMRIQQEENSDLVEIVKLYFDEA